VAFVSDIQPGWYKDPADPSTQRYWDGEGWTGEPIPADADPPVVPPGAGAHAPPQPSAPWGITAPDLPRLGLPPWRGTPVPPARGDTAPPGLQLGGAAAVPAGFVLATPGIRMAARLVDIVAVLLLGAAANWLFAYRWWQLFWAYVDQITRLHPQAGDTLPAAPDQLYNLGLIILVITTAVWFAYEVPSSANSGQTLGKRLVGIKVMRLESEERLGFGRSWRRWSRLGLPTLLWWCCGIGLVIQLLDCFSVAVDTPLHQALHDKAAATVVVRTNRPTSNPRRVRVGGNDERSDPPRS
jgi:uncharacterized RDD family membrane protein YckC